MLESTGNVCRDAEMAQGVRHGQSVVHYSCQIEGALELTDGGVVLAVHHLFKRTQPEQRLGLTAAVTELTVESEGPLEQGMLARVIDPLVEEVWVTRPRASARTPSSSEMMLRS